MNDPWPLHSPYPTQMGAVGQQCIEQSPAAISWGRMHHHTSGLIYKDQMVILIEDIQGDILSL